MKFPAQGPMSVAEMEYENFQGQNFILFRVILKKKLKNGLKNVISHFSPQLSILDSYFPQILQKMKNKEVL